MKAIVLEVKNGYAAVMREDGVVTKTRQPCQVGETIELTSEVVPFPINRKRLLRNAVAAVLALSLAGGSYGYTTAMAASYISLDVNDSSMEFSINRIGRVISVKGINNGGELLAEALEEEVRNKTVDDAMDVAMVRLREEGYLTSSGTVIAGVAADKEEKRSEIARTVERSVIRHSSQETQVVTLEATRSERGEARRKDQSTGRFLYEHRGMGGPPRPENGEGEAGVSWGIGLHAVTPEEEEEEAPPETEQTVSMRENRETRQNTQRTQTTTQSSRSDTQTGTQSTQAQNSQNGSQSGTQTGGTSASGSDKNTAANSGNSSGNTSGTNDRQGTGRNSASGSTQESRTQSGSQNGNSRPNTPAAGGAAAGGEPGSTTSSPTEQADTQPKPEGQPDTTPKPEGQTDTTPKPEGQPDTTPEPEGQPAPESGNTSGGTQTVDQGIDRSLYPLDPEDEPFLTAASQSGGTRPSGQDSQGAQTDSQTVQTAPPPAPPAEASPKIDGASVREGGQDVPAEPENRPEVTSDAVRENPSDNRGDGAPREKSGSPAPEPSAPSAPSAPSENSGSPGGNGNNSGGNGNNPDGGSAGGSGGGQEAGGEPGPASPDEAA